MGAISVVVAAAIGGYFLASHLGILPKGKVASIQQISELQPESLVSAPAAEQQTVLPSAENIINDIQNPDSQQAPAINNQNAKTTDNSVDKRNDTTGKTVDKKTETSAKADSPSGSVGKIVSRLVSFGFQKSSSRTIRAIIIHT